MKTLLIVLLVLLVLYLFLIAPRMFGKPDRSRFMGVHYAHRGLFDNASDAPENSLAAIRLAVENGYGIEMDVQLSKDGIPVVFHDATLKRMCGVDGKVWEYTLEELQQMKLASSNETIPTFADVLETVAGKVPLIIEYKLDRVQTQVCELANELLTAYEQKYNGTYCIESFHPFAVIWYKKNRPDIVRGQLSMEFWRDEKHKNQKYLIIMAFLLTNFLSRPDFIAYQHCDYKNISRQLCKMMGALSVTWTIKSTEQYEKVKDQFDLFIFDSCRL